MLSSIRYQWILQYTIVRQQEDKLNQSLSKEKSKDKYLDEDAQLSIDLTGQVEEETSRTLGRLIREADDRGLETDSGAHYMIS